MKALSPTTDPGLFDLQIDGTTDADATNVGHNGLDRRGALEHRHPHRRRDRRHRTDLADYQKSIECLRPTTAPAPWSRARRRTTPARWTSRHDRLDIVCTITNTRETGTLEVSKKLSPTTDPGRSTSRSTARTDADATNVGDGGTTGAVRSTPAPTPSVRCGHRHRPCRLRLARSRCTDGGGAASGTTPAR